MEAMITSGLSVKAWCSRNKISTERIYKYANELGYMKEGKRTEKWTKKDPDKSAANPVKDEQPEFVQIPVETILGTNENNTEYAGRYSGIDITVNGFSVSVTDSFSPNTLKKVLEVLKGA